MTRRRAGPISVGMAVLAAAVLLAVSMSGVAFASHKQTPILECVFHDTGTGQWSTVWGYHNNSGSVENIAIGSGNYFSPGAQNEGQPTSFQPGQNDKVFVVTWSGTGSLTWNLNGESATATTSSMKCSKNPVPIVAGTDGWGVEVAIVLLALGILGVGYFCWRSDLGLVVHRRH